MVMSGCAAKLNKSIKTKIIEILILILAIPRKINFLQLGRYGRHGEQCYRQTFGRLKQVGIDPDKALNAKRVKELFGIAADAA